MHLGMPNPHYFIEIAWELRHLYYVPFYDNIQNHQPNYFYGRNLKSLVFYSIGKYIGLFRLKRFTPLLSKILYSLNSFLIWQVYVSLRQQIMAMKFIYMCKNIFMLFIKYLFDLYVYCSVLEISQIWIEQNIWP